MVIYAPCEFTIALVILDLCLKTVACVASIKIVQLLFYVGALVLVGSMGSFEPMDFWNFIDLTNYYSQKKEFRV